jgi:hypothetical protein
MALAASYYGKGDSAGQPAESVWEQARAFAQGPYALALQQGNLLPADERTRLAAEMAGWLGVSTDFVEGQDLRVNSQAFLEELLDAENKLVGRLDTRVSAEKKPPANPDRPAAANDPSLGLGRSNVIVSQEIGEYLRDRIGVEADRDYNSLTLDVNFKWDWDADYGRNKFFFNMAPRLAGAMEEAPGMDILVLGGLYDLATPVLGARYAFTHAGIPADRMTLQSLVAGHSPFDTDATREIFAGTIARFIRDNSR